jgi:hypothetical protein
VTRCHICERPVSHDHDPFQPDGHYDDERWTVAMGNGIFVAACWSCWFKWPDERKLFPAVGFGCGEPPVTETSQGRSKAAA